jgi:hypothetical protein
VSHGGCGAPRFAGGFRRTGELTVRSEEFRSRGAKAEVWEKTSGVLLLKPPKLATGDLDHSPPMGHHTANEGDHRPR